MSDALAGVSTRVTPQSQPSSKAKTPNRAGGYTFKVTDETRLHRFLTLGVDGGTYYASEKELTAESADLVICMARSGYDNKGKYLVDQIVDVSTKGRAPRQNPAIFALAVAAGEGDERTRQYALSQLSAVCRTGTHLFLFLKYVKNFRGWGRSLKRAVANWYDEKATDKLAYQVLKYRQREGFTHRDALRLSKPAGVTGPKSELFNFICGREATLDDPSLALVWDYYEVQHGADPVEVINRGNGISWEMLPDSAVTKPEVWEALLHQGVPIGALLRQVPRLTRLGLATGSTGRLIVSQMTDAERLKKGRIHPVNVLIAAKTYAAGRGRGSTWTPEPRIIDAFNDAFYLAYGAVEPAGKRTLLALDCSSSMGAFAGGTPISCFEAEVALSLVIQNTEPEWEIVGFSGGRFGGSSVVNGKVRGISKLPISPRQRLDDAVKNARRFNWGGTDCALPMLWAKQEKLDIDTFIVMTDSETWAGNIHPHQALQRYRDTSGIDAKLIVCAFTGTYNTIADPDDPRELDVSGFDSSVPSLISNFSRGDL